MSDGEDDYLIQLVQIKNHVGKTFDLSSLRDCSMLERPAPGRQLNFQNNLLQDV